MEKIRQFQVATGVIPPILGALLFVTGCAMVKSESDVLGEYELRVGKGKIVLKVSPDKSFSEMIYWPNGKLESRSGKWLWSQNGIGFDQLWIPPEFAPDYILRADSSAKENKQPKYTEPGYWWGRPEKHWGTVTWPVFPDADVSFKMVRRFRE
jgi:hypothetical protein